MAGGGGAAAGHRGVALEDNAKVKFGLGHTWHVARIEHNVFIPGGEFLIRSEIIMGAGCLLEMRSDDAHHTVNPNSGL
jgi:hypothetical protein